MIRYVTPQTLPSLLAFCRGDPFGCKIASLAQAYGLETAFAGFWLQTEENKTTAALSRLDDAAVLFAPGEADWEEWERFLTMLGVSVLQCGMNAPFLPGWKTREGAVLKLTAPLWAKREPEPGLREVYRLLKSCDSPDFRAPPSEQFYVDMSHRVRHRAARVRGAWEEGTLAACALTIAETETAALLGAVAACPDKRRKGCGSRAVRQLCGELLQENKEIFLFRAEAENEAFYEGLGFSPCGRWRELERE